MDFLYLSPSSLSFNISARDFKAGKSTESPRVSGLNVSFIYE
jgi:hypothetical protein